MIFRYGFIGLLALAAMPNTAANATGAFVCPKQPPATLELVIDNQDVEIINHKNTHQLAAKHTYYDLGWTPYSSSAGDKGHRHVGGLYHGPVSIGFQVNTVVDYSRDRQSACVGVSALELTVTYKPTIHIEREARPGSCEYQAILGHEYKHMAVDLTLLREHIPKFREVSDQALVALSQPSPIDAQNVRQERENVQQFIVDAVKRAKDQFREESIALQTAVDTPEEYERVAKECM